MNELTHSLTTNKMAVNMSWRKNFQPSVPLTPDFFYIAYVSPLNLTSRGGFRPISLRSVSFLILFIYFKCTVMCMWILKKKKNPWLENMTDGMGNHNCLSL